MKEGTDKERTCIVCRTARPATELLSVGWAGAVVLAPSGERRAYVCISRDCLSRLDAKELGRALKKSVASIDGAQVVGDAHRLAHARVLESVGLARRSGVLEVGTDLVLGDGSGTAVVASDLAERTVAQGKRAGAVIFSTSEELGRAAGMGRVGALRIREGRLAANAAYWLSVWSATGPEAGTPRIEVA